MHPKGANSMAVPGLSLRKALVGTGWAIYLLCVNGLREHISHTVWLPFSSIESFFTVCENMVH